MSFNDNLLCERVNGTLVVKCLESATAGQLSPTDLAVIATAIIALLALSLTLYQSYLARSSFHLAHKPILQFEKITDHSEDDSYKSIEICILNKGLGNAIVKNATIFIDGNPVYGFDKAIHFDSSDLRLTVIRRYEQALKLPHLSPSQYFLNAEIDRLSSKTIIKKDEKIVLIKVKISSNAPFEHTKLEDLLSIRLEVASLTGKPIHPAMLGDQSLIHPPEDWN